VLVRALIYSLLIAAVAPGLAQAASVSVVTGVTEPPNDQVPYVRVHYLADPGDENTLRIDRLDRTLTFTDRAGIRAGTRCEQMDSSTAVCDALVPFAMLAVDLGDRDDVLQIGVASRGDEANLDLTASGGPGADILDLRAADGVAAGSLQGDDGDDSLFSGGGGGLAGGLGDDILTGGDGAEELDGGLGDDVLDGGAGLDIVTYGDRTDSVRVDLADPAPDGAVGEADVIAHVEHLAGGRGSDVLLGTDGPNQIFGSWRQDEEDQVGGDRIDGRGGDDWVSGTRFPDVLTGGGGADRLRSDSGADLLRAGAGDDRLEGGFGPDRMFGGTGDDYLLVGKAGATRPDRVWCGGGHDTVPGTDSRLLTLLRPACERPFDGVTVTRWAFERDHLTLRALEHDFVCRVTFRLGEARITRTLRPGHARTIRLPTSGRRAFVQVNGPCGEGRFPLHGRFLFARR
jgi:hypothetical protein